MSFFKMKPTYHQYNPLYPKMFEEEKEILKELFGNLAKSIRHFGKFDPAPKTFQINLLKKKGVLQFLNWVYF